MGDNRNSYLMKNTIIFTLGNFGSKLISFFLIPLYTNVLTTTEYGVVDLCCNSWNGCSSGTYIKYFGIGYALCIR